MLRTSVALILLLTIASRSAQARPQQALSSPAPPQAISPSSTRKRDTQATSETMSAARAIRTSSKRFSLRRITVLPSFPALSSIAGKFHATRKHHDDDRPCALVQNGRQEWHFLSNGRYRETAAYQRTLGGVWRRGWFRRKRAYLSLLETRSAFPAPCFLLDGTGPVGQQSRDIWTVRQILIGR